MNQLSPTEVFPKRDEVQLLDVREQVEWDAGHIEGAVHVPMGSLQTNQSELATDRQIVVVCRSGARSASVTQALLQAGYDAANLLGGMHAWSDADLPFVSDGPDDPYVA